MEAKSKKIPKIMASTNFILSNPYKLFILLVLCLLIKMIFFDLLLGLHRRQTSPFF